MDQTPAVVEFSVLQFSIETTPDGRLTQRVSKVGRFRGIEAAFSAARRHAWQAWRALADGKVAGRDPVAPGMEPEMRDTEWGYDLRVDAKTVARFWVHDARAGDALAM
jgi:hypothetical protein